MKQLQLFLDIQHHNHKVILLYRFHIVVILVNIIASIIDTFMQRYSNTFLELTVVFTLSISLLHLRKNFNTKFSAHLFIFILSTALLTLIYLNHFATMSIIFILLLPLTTLLFLELKESLFITLLLFVAMGILLFIESIYNPSNTLAHNPQALFNLTYTALIIYIFGLLYHFSILKTFKELDDANHQKALLLKEVHHRVKNNLNVISSIIGLQSNSLEGKEQEELLKSTSRIESIAIVHEMLYKDENFESVNIIDYIKRLSKLLLSIYGANKEINIHIKSDIESISLNVMVQLGIMINELLTNSIKYAFNHNYGLISINITDEKEFYLFTYSDNGIGHPNPEELNKSKSLGIKLIFLTAKQLKGNVTISSQNGLKYNIRFKHE